MKCYLCGIWSEYTKVYRFQKHPHYEGLLIDLCPKCKLKELEA